MNNNTRNYIIAAIVVVIIVIFAIVASKGDKAPVETSNQQATSTPAQSTSTTSTKPAAPKPLPTNTNSSQTPTPTVKNAIVISYTNAGFNPAKLEVTAGTSVRFINNSTMTMMIAQTDSTVAPVLSGFGQESSVGKGGFYDYNFNNRGVWMIENMNNANHKIIVTVK